jgi:anaerobic magnesium-protoporphyrin IX monomethyl ester cyclase
VTYVLESILYGLGEDHESFHLDHLWTGDAEPRTTNPEVMLLSTTFICNRPTLARAIGWIDDRYPGVPLILGGQYSNLKYATILRDHPQVSFP